MINMSFPSLIVKQVFKDMEFLGWYTTGGPPDPSDIHIHKQVGQSRTSRWWLGPLWLNLLFRSINVSRFSDLFLFGLFILFAFCNVNDANPLRSSRGFSFASIRCVRSSRARCSSSLTPWPNTPTWVPAALTWTFTLTACSDVADFDFFPSLQLPVSVYESVIDIISGEVIPHTSLPVRVNLRRWI